MSTSQERIPSTRLEDILSTDELTRRPSRQPDAEAECRAFTVLAKELARDPDNLLQKLADTALDLGLGDSVGVSILDREGDSEFFRWDAVAGPFAHNRGSTIPRSLSPCGLVLDRDAVLLLDRPARYFTALLAAEPPIVEALLVPFHAAGKPVGTVWAIAHATERRFDGEDARLLAELSSLASAGHQLTTALRTAEQASQAKSRFLAMMSHELRTPLTSILVYTDMLEAEMLGPVTPRQREVLSKVKDGSLHLEGIISEVLTLSRVDAGKEVVHRAEADLATLVREVVGVFEPLVDRARVCLRLDGADGVLPVCTDAAKVRHILTNLVGNAVKFTRDGEIAVRVEGAAEQWVEIHIQDTGPGIAREAQERVFEPFVQVDSSHTRTASGIGLGLAICRHLARLLGGDVTVESAPGEGSTFTLRLPR